MSRRPRRREKRIAQTVPVSRLETVEPLETRRLLSRWTMEAILAAGEHNPGCCCGGCAADRSRRDADPQLILDAINRTAEAIRSRPVVDETPTPPVFYPPTEPVTATATPESLFPGVGAQPTGALSGRIVYIGAGHGWTARNTTNGTWYTQRPETNEMIEDMGNQDQMQFYANYLWNAGATVVPLRPIGDQPNEVVLDNDDPGVTFTGSWSNSSSSPYFGSAGDAVRFRFATGSLTETAVATYTPNLPQAGFYPVYAWALDGSNRKTDQLYRVNHSGGSTEVKINHQWVGKGWVYLGTFHFNAGAAGNVQISNRSSTSGGAVIADAIRFGNGMGDITRGGPVSGAPRQDEQSLYWIEVSKGVGVDEFYRGGNSDDGDANVGAPTRWAAYMNAAPFGQAVHLSFHSNAGGGRGTVGLYNNETLFPNTATPNQFAWAQLVGKEVNDDMVAIGAPPLEFAWSNRTNPTFARSDFAFGEIRTSANGDEFDSTILEVAFHDNASDAALMRDPKVRNWVGRASYQATVKYFNQFGGLANNALLPEPPTDVRVTQDASGNVTVRWSAPVVDGIGGQAATGYRLYSSANGYGFDAGIAIAGGGTLSYTLPAGSIPPGSDAVYFRVSATNAGGESLPSSVVGVRRGAATAGRVLVVNGFSRLDRNLNVRQTLPNGGLVIDRVRQRAGNSFDYVVQAGEAIEAFGPTPVGFDSATSRSVELEHVQLADYAAVVWLAGEQSTADRTFTSGMQVLVGAYLNAGGKLFVSGSEIGWDLVANNNGAAFFNSLLRAGYVGDDANTYVASGAPGSIFAGISLQFDNGALFYNVDFPDRLATSAGSSVAMNYVGGTGGAAAVQYADANGTSVVTMGFPFETITTTANRNAVMAAVLNFFFADLVPPQVVASQFNFLTQQSIQVVFSEDVSGSLAPADLLLTNVTTGQVVPTASLSIAYAPGLNVATITAAPLLADGDYTLTFAPGGVTDPSGNALVTGAPIEFFVLAGDGNRDRRVDIADFSALASNFNQSPRNFAQGDFNYDGTVGIADFSILAANFNVALPGGAFGARSAPATVVQSVFASTAPDRPTPFAGGRLIGSVVDREPITLLSDPPPSI